MFVFFFVCILFSVCFSFFLTIFDVFLSFLISVIIVCVLVVIVSSHYLYKQQMENDKRRNEELLEARQIEKFGKLQEALELKNFKRGLERVDLNIVIERNKFRFIQRH